MYSIIRRNWAENRIAVVVGIGTVLSTSTLIAFQAVVSPTFAFFALIVGGIAVGLSWTEPRKALTAAFLVGYAAYFLGTIAYVGGASLADRYPVERIAAEIAIAAFAGLIIGVVAGLWTVGGGILGTVARRRLLVRPLS